jgi:hypothetical protein
VPLERLEAQICELAGHLAAATCRFLLALGRRRQAPNAAIRRAARERDHGRCGFSGCESRRADLHHLVYWARGGRTDLANLLVRQYLEHAPRRTGPIPIPIQV